MKLRVFGILRVQQELVSKPAWRNQGNAHDQVDKLTNTASLVIVNGKAKSAVGDGHPLHGLPAVPSLYCNSWSGMPLRIHHGSSTGNGGASDPDSIRLGISLISRTR